MTSPGRKPTSRKKVVMRAGAAHTCAVHREPFVIRMPQVRFQVVCPTSSFVHAYTFGTRCVYIVWSRYRAPPKSITDRRADETIRFDQRHSKKRRRHMRFRHRPVPELRDLPHGRIMAALHFGVERLGKLVRRKIRSFVVCQP